MARLRHDDSGFSLIEVLVSALLVAVLAGSTLSVISGSGNASAAQRSRSQGSSVARAVHEALRTQSPATIAGYVTAAPADPPPITRNGITFTSHTTAAWVDETSGGASCTGTANVTRFVRLTTTTSWRGRDATGATTATSKVSSLTGIPADGGRLVVQVFDRNKNPQSGVRVDLTGTATANATTGAG